MVSCIEVETASLVFAILSLISSCIGFLVCIAMMVHVNVLMAYLISTGQKNVQEINEFQIGISNYGLYMNVVVATTMAFVIVCLIFSVILTKGLLSKKAHLVKAYFIYGVTANTISGILALFATVKLNMLIGLTSLFGCFLYTIILIMIMTTYVKMSTIAPNQFGHKKLETENPIV